MFDQPPSLPLRAAMASLLGSLFGIGLILATHSANAQTSAVTASAAATPAAETGAAFRRLGDAALRSLRSPEPTPGSGAPGSRGLRINDSGSDAGTGLRWQMAPRRVLRSEVENPRGNDQVSVGVQLRF